MGHTTYVRTLVRVREKGEHVPYARERTGVHLQITTRRSERTESLSSTHHFVTFRLRCAAKRMDHDKAYDVNSLSLSLSNYPFLKYFRATVVPHLGKGKAESLQQQWESAVVRCVCVIPREGEAKGRAGGRGDDRWRENHRASRFYR